MTRGGRSVTSHTNRRFELAGWVIFVASACFFLIATIRSGDLLSIAGSALFLLACFVFMVPLLRARPLVVENRDCGDGK